MLNFAVGWASEAENWWRATIWGYCLLVAMRSLRTFVPGGIFALRDSQTGVRSMKIMFLARALGPGGAERQMALLASGLQSRDHDVTVVTFYPAGIFRQSVIEAGVRHISLEKRGRWDVIRFLFRLRRLLIRERPDILYSFLPMANIVAAGVRPRSRGMRHVWGIRVSEMELSQYDWLQRLSYALELRLSRLADLIVFNAQSGYRLAKARGMFVDRGVVVPNGIDTVQFAPNVVARLKIRQWWHIADGDRVIGMVGRFDPMKDHTNFVLAAKELLRSQPDLWFVFAGAGVDAQNARLKELLHSANLSDRALLLGERQDIPTVMAGFDILCLSSAFGEGFPNVVGESMAVGTPCVATDIGDCRSIIGSTGELAAPRDPAALAHAMDRLLMRLEQAPNEIRNSARARIVENFSVGRLIDRTEEVLEQLIRHPAAAKTGDDAVPLRN